MSTTVYYIEVNMICVVLLALFLYGTVRGGYRSVRNHLYQKMLLSAMVLSVMDMIAGTLRGRMFEGAATLLWSSNMLT